MALEPSPKNVADTPVCSDRLSQVVAIGHPLDPLGPLAVVL
jgi:hypothetical protein